jgi:hypothetical protein
MAVSQPISGNAPPLVDPSGDPLAALRDIHLPAPIETWPPAIGWWLLAVIGVIACIAIIYALRRYWRANQYRREAIAQLRQLREQHADTASDYLYHYTILLKRVALTHYPRAKVAALTGEAWVAFLDETCGSREFSMGAGQMLVQGQYQAAEHLDEEIDIDALHKLGEYWIKRHRDLPMERSASSERAGERAANQEVSLT